MNGPLLLLLIHAAATLAMVGLIWTIQIVHYPLFAEVGAEAFTSYEQSHQRRIGSLLALPWAIEVTTALVIAIWTPNGIAPGLAWFGVAVALLVVAVTVVVFAPIHGNLGNGFDLDEISRLVNLNWIRTALWSLHGVIALAMLAQYAER